MPCGMDRSSTSASYPFLIMKNENITSEKEESKQKEDVGTVTEFMPGKEYTEHRLNYHLPTS